MQARIELVFGPRFDLRLFFKLNQAAGLGIRYLHFVPPMAMGSSNRSVTFDINLSRLVQLDPNFMLEWAALPVPAEKYFRSFHH